MASTTSVDELAGRLKQALPSISNEDETSPPPVRDPQQQLETFILHLLSPELSDTDPHLTAIGYELEALLSMYPSALKLTHTSRASSPHPSPHSQTSSTSARTSADASTPAAGASHQPQKRMSQAWDNAVFDASIWTPGERIRYEVLLPLWEVGEVLDGLKKADMPADVPNMRILVSLPPTYPQSSAPQLQLLGRYLGNYSIDAGLFGDITRTFIASTAVPFSAGDVCVFEGLQYSLGVARKWYAARLSEGAEGERQREDERRRGRERDGRLLDGVPISPMRGTFADYDHISNPEAPPSRPDNRPTFSYSRDTTGATASSGAAADQLANGSDGVDTPATVTQAKSGQLPHFTIHVSQPIMDRKSTFVGHAIRVTDEREIPLVIHEILSDKKVAKAAHPAMFAYRIARDVGGVAGKVILTDCDDDGETAAGSRLAHLLEILEVENVLVVVSRWYGGVLLGADRFKHINQAARDALEAGGFLVDERPTGKGRRR